MCYTVKFSNLFKFEKFRLFFKQTKSYFSYNHPFKEMPRNIKEIEALKEHRIKNKKNSKNTRYPPGEIYLCVLGNGSASSSRALYMFTDHERYLFNCGEGTQRLAQEHKTKLSKLNHIFVTHNSWENIGGLPGMALTLQDMGVPEITLHGPSNLDLLYENLKSFAPYNMLDIKTEDFKNGRFSDDCMEVTNIPIFADSHDSESSFSASSSDSFESSSEDSSCGETIEPKLKKRCRSFQSNQQREDVTVAFACKGFSKPGHLMYDKCIELGVPPGPLLGDLKNGKDVTLPSGKIVQSKDVVSEEQKCPLFLVVECPSIEFLQPFVNEEKFQQYQNNSSFPGNIASLVVHFTPSHIINTSEYQQWINKFPDSTTHFILNRENSTLSSAAVHRIQHKLNMLHPEIFSLLHEKEFSEDLKKHQRQNIIQANTLERYQLRPANGLNRSTALKIDVKEYIEEAMKVKGFEESLKTLNSNIHQHSNALVTDDHFPVVTFLGTGSCIPCKARNVSAILVKSNENNNVLLDCGEGTFGQLVRFYGKEYEKVVEQISCIFISHIHADHHLGLIKILKEREAIFRKQNKKHKPVLIIGPKVIKTWLKNYSRSIEHLSYRFFLCSNLNIDECMEIDQDIIENNQDINVFTVPVRHCKDAYGAIVIQKDSKWKLVYSGDTMPCDKLVDAGKNCTILIHEATMEDELSDEAVCKRHSTTTEAIQMGEKMKSNYTILTHFSQRYAKIPLFNENFHNHVGCAFDNMSVRSNQLHILPLLIPTLKCLFAEDVEEMNIKGDKRRNKVKQENLAPKESVTTAM